MVLTNSVKTIWVCWSPPIYDIFIVANGKLVTTDITLKNEIVYIFHYPFDVASHKISRFNVGW